jgi:hypothetical protein
MLKSDVNEVSRSFNGFDVSVTTGSRRKQALSNRVVISTDDGRTSTSLRLTIRQARALQRILNDTIAE